MNYLKVSELKSKNIIYGFFTRKDGVSSNNFESLNCSYSSGDDKSLVKKNIELAMSILGLQNKRLKFLKQTHSSNIEIITKKNIDKLTYADGSITQDKNIALAILTADCAPIILFNKKNTVICNIHSGWKGCLNNIIKKAISLIIKENNFLDDLIAIVGPCMEKQNFEVSTDLKNLFINSNIKYDNFFSNGNKNDKYFFDMRGLINLQIRESGVKNIYNLKKDTYSNNQLFFSHRYSVHNGCNPTGRMINIVAFKD
tara:strand:+ start:129 stop:896 length:768 start_codon:yes stop_codon:yes gene_type:complete